MSIYTDFDAQANADNSYFSVSSVVARVSEFISDESSLIALEEELKAFYIPAFTVDVTANFVTIGVYPLYGESSTIQLSKTEGATPVVTSGIPEDSPATTIGNFEKISPIDGVFGVEVDPLTHTDSVIKRPVGLESLPIEPTTGLFSEDVGFEVIENLFLSKFPQSVNPQNDLDKLLLMKSKLSIVVDIVASQSAAFDPEVKDQLVTEYNSWVNKVEKLQEFLLLVKEQQEEIIDLLDESKIKTKLLNKGDGLYLGQKSVWSSVVDDFGDTLNQIRNRTGMYCLSDETFKHTDLSETPPSIPFWSNTTNKSVNSGDSISKRVTDATFTVDGMKAMGLLLQYGDDGGSNTGAPNYTEDLFYRKVVQVYLNMHPNLLVENSTLVNDSIGDIENETMMNWYAEEIDSLMLGKKSPQSAKLWALSFDEISQKIVKSLKLENAGGGPLLVFQSLLKAIDALVDSDLDITPYLGTNSIGETWLSEISSSSILGHGNVGIGPNLSFDEEYDNEQTPGTNFESTPMSDTKYLNYATLIRFLQVFNRDIFPNGPDKSGWAAYKRQLLNSDLSSRPNTSIFNVGDFIRGIGGHLTSFLVSPKDFDERLWTPKDTSEQRSNDKASSPYVGGVEFWPTARTSSYPNQYARYTQLSGVCNSEQILGVNWQTIKPNNTIRKTSAVGQMNAIYGRVPGRGPVNFHACTFRSPEDAEFRTANQSVHNSKVALKSFYDDRKFCQIGTYRASQIETVMDISSYRESFLSFLEDKLLENSAGGLSTGSARLQALEVARNKGCSVIPTGTFFGHLHFPSYDNDGTRYNMPGLFSSTALGAIPGDVLHTGNRVSQKSVKNKAMVMGWGSAADTSYGPLSWDSQSTYQLNFANNRPYWTTMHNDYFRSSELNGNQASLYGGFRVSNQFTNFGPSMDYGHWWANETSSFGAVLPLQWKPICNKRSHPHASSVPSWAYRIDRENPTTDDMDLESWKDYFKMKGGGVIRFFGASEGIIKGLFIKMHEILLESLDELTGEKTDWDEFYELLSTDTDELERHGDMFFKMIEHVVDSLESQSSHTWDDHYIRVNPAGGLTLFDESYLVSITTPDKSHTRRLNENCTTENNSKLAKEYMAFKARISSKSVLTVGNNVKEERDWMTYFPPEIMRKDSNPNWAQNYGPSGQYIDVYPKADYPDPLKIKRSYISLDVDSDEFEFNIPGTNIEQNEKWRFCIQHGAFTQLTTLLEGIKDPIVNFSEYMESLQIDEDVKGPYEEGLITAEDISKAGKILPLITTNLEYYRADSKGISGLWNDLIKENGAIDTFHQRLSKCAQLGQLDSGGIFLSCIGISEDFVQWDLSQPEDKKYYIDVDRNTTGWKNSNDKTTGIFIPTATGLQRAAIGYNGGQIGFYGPGTGDEILDPNQSQRLGKAMHSWIHLCKGFRVDETVFIDNYEQLYSEFLVENEAGKFPWSSSDFEDGKPIVDVESIYNVSSWLFPKNFFMQVVKPREFRYVIPVLVKVPTTLMSTSELNSSEENLEKNFFQGNIKFNFFEPYNSNLWTP